MSETFPFMLALAISVNVCVLLLTVFLGMRVKFSKTRSINELTLKPYYLLTFYLFCQIIQHSCTMAFGTRSITYWNQFSVFAINQVESAVILVQVLEWLLYALMVTF
jgi:hypothetical protein